MSPLVTAGVIVGVVAYVLFVVWALCKAAALGDQVRIVPDDQECQ